jgi:GrpB-like predicted nucleotidyltransferase (UPF0157 family)
VVEIEHVGSTSVRGRAAKPVIDCDIVVAEQDVWPARRRPAGWVLASGRARHPQRWAFREPVRLADTNTYVGLNGCLSLRNQLAALASFLTRVREWIRP